MTLTKESSPVCGELVLMPRQADGIGLGSGYASDKHLDQQSAVNYVLTVTANPDHALDNIGAGFGAMPDDATRERIVTRLRSLCG